LETGEFVINVPTQDIKSEVMKAAIITEKPCPAGINEIEKAGLTPIASEKVKPPRVRECVAHYECLLDWHKGDLIFGKTVAVSVDRSVMDGADSRKVMLIAAKGRGSVDSSNLGIF
jgi:flavin reductase (DIM6/NTAB) family NADH-FMN oxidoreductase RutF